MTAADKGSHQKRLEYISDMLTQLAEMARSDGEDQLAYLIDIAQLDAQEKARRSARSRKGGQGGGSSDTAPPG